MLDERLQQAGKKVGAEVVGTACIIELTFLDGRSKLDGVPFDSLVAYDE